MNRASLPLLELATLSVVILGCVIAVVPGADSYVLHLLSPSPQSSTVDTRLIAENTKPLERAKEQVQPNEPQTYPERFASREPLPIAAPSDALVLDWSEQKLPEPVSRSISKSTVEPSHDEWTLLIDEDPVEEADSQSFDDMLEEASEPLDFHESDKIEIPATAAVSNEPSEPALDPMAPNLDPSEPTPDPMAPTHEPSALAQIVGNNEAPFSTVSVSPVQSVDADSEPVAEPMKSKFAETIERFKATRDAGKEVKTAYQSVSWIKNTTLSQASKNPGLIKNQFVDPANPTGIPGQNQPMLQPADSDWDFEELPARQLGPIRSSKRLPMAAESMQGNNDFRFHRR